MATLKRWVLRNRPQGEIRAEDLELVEEPVRDLADGEVLVRTVYLSLDPTNRIWMSDQDQYMPPVGIGDTMRGGSIGVVEQSRSGRFKQGDVVNTGLGGWTSRVVANEGALFPVPQMPGVPLTAYMSVLGATGLTAWFGMCEIGQPKPGETVVVSAAAGAVGSIAGQIAKLKGASSGSTGPSTTRTRTSARRWTGFAPTGSTSISRMSAGRSWTPWSTG